MVEPAPSSERHRLDHLGGWILLMLFLVAAPSTAPLAAAPARAAPRYRVGIVGAEPTQVWDAFGRRLQDLGYVEGRNLILERRWFYGYPERMRSLMTELLGMKPNVLVTSMFPPAVAVDPGHCVPILLIGVGEPYGPCRIFPVVDMSFSSSAKELSAAHLRLTTTAIRSVSQIAVITDSGQSFLRDYVSGLQAAAVSSGVTVYVLDLTRTSDVDSLFAAITRQGPDAVIMAPGLAQPAFRRQIVHYLTTHRIPTIGSHVGDGVVVAADYDWVELGRRAASVVDRILTGVRPADLHLDDAAKLEVTIDLKAASAVGLTIPPSVLQQADRLLE
jgi:putative tryptophan/tyrosine transport system substrate-binding protein